jgi:hypothetical protein
MTEKEPIPAGWYQAPGEPSLDRWWDGDAWTARSRPRPLAGLRPASPKLIEHDDGRHPLPWVCTAVGVGLLVAALLTWRSPHHLPAALLATGGVLVLSVSTALLRADLAPRTSAVAGLVVGAVILAAGIGAALTGTAPAWIPACSAVILVAKSLLELRAAKHRRAHA